MAPCDSPPRFALRLAQGKPEFYYWASRRALLQISEAYHPRSLTPPLLTSVLLVCLHGWGGSKESFTELREALKDDTKMQILTPDLPGFGDEPEPHRPWSVDDYADWVEKWVVENGRWKMEDGDLCLLGHSHGGRIALKLAYRQSKLSIRHLFLCAPAGIRHARHFRRILGLTLAKSGKFILKIPGMQVLQPIAKTMLYKLVRVHDYEKASDIMRQTMIRVTAEDLRPILKDITIPTDLFWGKDDSMTPFSDALIMEKELPNAVLHAYGGVRHSVHRDRAQEIAATILAVEKLKSRR